MEKVSQKAGWFEVVTGADERVPHNYNLASKSYEPDPESLHIIFFLDSSKELGDEYWGDLRISTIKLDDGSLRINKYHIDHISLMEDYDVVLQLINEFHVEDPASLTEILKICSNYFYDGKPK